ncbi:MAG: proton-conducting transporter membrane subunit [Candidatus Edwardsbacteria bacterium]
MVTTINPTCDSILPLLVFVIPFCFSLLIFALGRFGRLLREGFAFLGLALTFLVALLMSNRILNGEVLTFWNANFYIDGLSNLMEVLGSLMGVVVVLYSIKYVKETSTTRLPLYYGLLLMFLSMMNWTCATNNMIMLWVSLEFTTLATTFLVTFYWDRPAMEAGYKYLMLVTAGVTFALLGCVLIYSAAVPYLPRSRVLLLTELGTIATKIPTNIVLLASAFLIVGFGTKAGLVPFHAWLPDAHAEAPAPISALLSGIVIKVGAYALARTITVFAPHYNAIVVFMAILCSFSMIVGMLMALVQDDLKRMLAYSSVAQIAYVVEGLGLGTYLGIYGGLFHLLNHSITKGLLFLCVGALMYATGKRKVSDLAGHKWRMPVTIFAFFVGVLSIGGLPPLNGFASKLTLFLAVAEAGLLWAVVIGIIASLFTVVVFFRAAYKIFWTEPALTSLGAEVTPVKEVPPTMWVGMLALSLLCILLGVYPQVVYPLLDSATKCILRILIGG